MKRAISKIPEVFEAEPTVNKWSGLNTFGPHADLKPGELRSFANFDNYGDYIKTRRGSQILINQQIPDENILNHVVFDSGDIEYLVVQQTDGLNSYFRFCEPTTFGVWQNVLAKTSGLAFTIPLLITKVDMFVSNGKIYIFSRQGNSIFEYNVDLQQFDQRKMGLPAPQITEIELAVVEPTIGPVGRRIYAVEFIYKDTTVVPAVDILASGPNRQKFVSNSDTTFLAGSFIYVDTITKQSNVVKIAESTNDGTNVLSSSNDEWTHVRLYRTKDLSTLTNAVITTDGTGGETEITGRLDELYQVQEKTRAEYLAGVVGGIFAFDADIILDDDFEFPNSPALGDILELVPFASAQVGVWHRGRIWGSGVLAVPGPSGAVTLPATESKIFYTPHEKNQYSESMGVLNAIECEPGDGQRMIGLYVFREDLVGIKEGKTGRIPYGDPSRKWITEDSVVGIEDRAFAQFVPNIGICAIVNDQGDFKIFGFDLAWHSDLFGLQISRPIRDIIQTFTAEDVDFLYANGKLMISGGKAEILVLAVEQKKGWSLYTYPLGGLSEAMFTFEEGRRVAILNKGQAAVEVEILDLDTDYNAVTASTEIITFDIITHRWQDEGGRALIQQRFLSVVAILNENISCQPYVNGRIWDIPFTMLPDPALYPAIDLRETEYQGYSRISPIANYIHYHITGFAPATIYSLMLNSLIQRGSIPRTFDPFDILPDEIVPDWVNVDSTGKDAGNASRDNAVWHGNDAGDASRITANYTGDDAGDSTRTN